MRLARAATTALGGVGAALALLIGALARTCPASISGTTACDLDLSIGDLLGNRGGLRFVLRGGAALLGCMATST